MCPGFDSRTRHHIWVEFVVEGFSPGSPVFLPPQKSTFLNSNSIRNSRASLNKVDYLLLLLLLLLLLEMVIGLSGVQFRE